MTRFVYIIRAKAGVWLTDPLPASMLLFEVRKIVNNLKLSKLISTSEATAIKTTAMNEIPTIRERELYCAEVKAAKQLEDGIDSRHTKMKDMTPEQLLEHKRNRRAEHYVRNRAKILEARALYVSNNPDKIKASYNKSNAKRTTVRTDYSL